MKKSLGFVLGLVGFLGIGVAIGTLIDRNEAPAQPTAVATTTLLTTTTTTGNDHHHTTEANDHHDPAGNDHHQEHDWRLG